MGSTYFPRRWYFGLAGVLLMGLISLQLLVPHNSFALSYTVNMGRVISATNYGSKAKIGTSNPYLGSPSTEFSGEMIESDNGSSLVATGWAKGQLCGSFPTVYSLNVSGGFGTYDCGSIGVSGDNVYTNEYDGLTGYWCHDYNGNCVNSIWYGNIGNMVSASVFGAYGQATEASDVWMGNKGGANAVYLQNIQYKSGPATPPTSWTSVKVAGSAVNTCASPCPFQYSYGFTSTVLYTYNWTP